jgi:hypothetical protein
MIPLDDIIVLDDIVDPATQDLIEETLLGPTTEWRFSRNMAYRKDLFPEVTNEQRKAITTFNHIIFNNGIVEKGNYDLYYKVIEGASSRLGLTVATVTNMRAQLQLPVTIVNKKGIPHVDKHDPNSYRVCLYYVNDVDGDTVLYKQTTENTTPKAVKNGEVDVLKTISPKKGRCVLFNGNIYHRGGMPTSDVRCVINYNLYLQ